MAAGQSRRVLKETGKTGQAGFILVPVLLALALLASIALAVSGTFHLEVKAGGALLRAAQARLLADGMTRIVALRLTERGWITHWRQTFTSDGMTAACQDQGAHVTVSIMDAAGLVDLNAAPLALLERLFAPLVQGRASALAAAIVDFRDADDEPLPNGGEASAYEAAGLPHGPKNAPFESAAELDQVLGMTPALYAQLRPLMTVHARQPGLDLTAAPLGCSPGPPLGRGRSISFANRLVVIRASCRSSSELGRRGAPS